MNWGKTYKDISRGYIKEIFSKYKTYKIKSNELAEQAESVPSTYNWDKPGVVGTHSNGQAWQKLIEKKTEYDKYLKEIDNVLAVMPGMFKRILIDYYIRCKLDISIYLDMGLPERTYYYIKAEAIKAFIDEYIARQITL